MRGEVWLVALEPTVGREIKKMRPAVVVSPNELNEFLDTVIVSPMTSGSSPAPYRVPVVFQGQKGLILAEQLRSVDRQRLARRVGRVPGKVLVETLRVLQEMFAE